MSELSNELRQLLNYLREGIGTIYTYPQSDLPENIILHGAMLELEDAGYVERREDTGNLVLWQVKSADE